MTTAEALLYVGISKPTFLKAKVPFHQGKKKGYKLYDPKILDDYFPNAVRILPPIEETTKTVSLEVSPEFEFNPSDHQAAFSNMLKSVKSVRGNTFSKEANGTLIESLIKADALESYYFEQLTLMPESTDMFRCWKGSCDVKIALTKKLSL